jgi:hypothetical protein
VDTFLTADLPNNSRLKIPKKIFWFLGLGMGLNEKLEWQHQSLFLFLFFDRWFNLRLSNVEAVAFELKIVLTRISKCFGRTELFFFSRMR